MEFKRDLLKKKFRELCPFFVNHVNHIQQSTEYIFTFFRQNILEHAFVRIFASPFDSVNGACRGSDKKFFARKKSSVASVSSHQRILFVLLLTRNFFLCAIRRAAPALFESISSRLKRFRDSVIVMRSVDMHCARLNARNGGYFFDSLPLVRGGAMSKADLTTPVHPLRYKLTLVKVDLSFNKVPH